METSDVESYILKSIPMAKHMGIRVKSCSEKAVELHLPLEGNTNHIGTSFGGSQLSASAIACWIYLRQRLMKAKIESEIVVQKNESHFYKPVDADSVIHAGLDDSKSANWEEFLKTLESKSKARIPLKAEVIISGNIATKFQGDFVAIKK